VFTGTVFIGITFTVLLWFTKSIHRTANRFLALALLTVVLWLVWVLGTDIRIENHFRYWNRLPLQCSMALGPLLYFYVLKMTRPEYKFRWMKLLHFIPVLLQQSVQSLVTYESVKKGVAIYNMAVPQQLNFMLQVMTCISVFGYLYGCHRLIERFYNNQKFNEGDRYRYEFRWLHRWLTGFGVLWLLGATYAAVAYFYYHQQLGLHACYWWYILMATMAIWMAAVAHGRPEPGVAIEVSAGSGPFTVTELKQKGAWLKKTMKAGQYYLDAELSLSSLAEKLGMPPHELSRIINMAFGKNFNDFVNEYRIREVARKMQDPAYDRLTLIGIAYDAGFNSKATFNRTFREMTGKSPKEYKNELKKEHSNYNLRPYSYSAALILNQETTTRWSSGKLNRNYMFRNYLKIAWRNLWRNKAFSAINIVGLSVGLASCMLIYLYTMDEVSYDRFNVNAQNIYHLVVDSKTPDGSAGKSSSTGDIPGPSFKRQLPEIQDYVRIQGADYTVRRGTEIFDQPALFADSNFFSVFTFPAIAGNEQSALKDIHSVVLSEEVAEKYFGKQNPVGKTLDLKVDDKFQPFTVTAVIKKSPQNSSIKIQMLLPKKLNGMDNQWINSFENTFIVVRSGTDIKRLDAKLNKVFMTDAATQLKQALDQFGFKVKMTYSLQPLLGMHTSVDYPADNGLVDNSNPMYSYILTGIALFIMAIACINFVNLTVARSLKRAKEIGIRKVVGGQRKQLIVQFLGESFILSFIAFVFAIILVELALPTFNTLSNKALAFSYLISFKLVAGYIGIFLLTGLLAGFYPALVLSGFNPVQSLYNRTQYAGKNYLSKSLVVLQFTLATFLIISTITIYSQFNYLMHFDLGYNDKNVVSITAFGLDKQKLPVFKNEMLKDPYVSSVTADQGGRWGTMAHINNGQQQMFDMKHIDEDYLPLFQVPIVKGRNFSKAIVSDSANSVLVNEEFVKQAGWKKPVGEVVDFFYIKKKYNVIGVVKNYHFLSLTEKMSPILYTMRPSYPWRNIFVKISDQNKSEALNQIQKEFKSEFPFIPYQYKFKDAEVAEQYDKEAKWKQIVTFGAVLTIFISCIGLFGLATLSAERRKKEIGIRKVLGASVEGIVRQLSTDFAKLVLLSAAISTPAAWWAMHKWLEAYPYKIDINAWIFLGAAVFVLLIALITVSFQTIRAAVANPVASLRSE
jgi:putative ABC transport system permease protein